MVPKASGIKSFRDLKGKSVVTTSGGTTIHVMKSLSDKHDLDFPSADQQGSRRKVPDDGDRAS